MSLTNQWAYTLHNFAVFVLFVLSEAFLPVQLQKIIAHFSMAVNVLALNKYMIIAATILSQAFPPSTNEEGGTAGGLDLRI